MPHVGFCMALETIEQKQFMDSNTETGISKTGVCSATHLAAALVIYGAGLDITMLQSSLRRHTHLRSATHIVTEPRT